MPPKFENMGTKAQWTYGLRQRESKHMSVDRDIHNKIEKLINSKKFVKEECDKSFEKLVGNGKGLTSKLLPKFKADLELAMGMPDIPAHEYTNSFELFDFDGNGYLDKNESYKLIRAFLISYGRSVTTEAKVVVVPSPEAYGYRQVKVLAAGGQGSAVLAEADQAKVCQRLNRNDIPKTLLLKTYDKTNANAGGIEDLRDEMLAMQDLGGCDGIAHVFEMFQDSGFYYITSSLNSGGDLLKLRENTEKQGVSLYQPRWWARFVKRCFEALRYMHVNAIMHCDIKEANIMVKEAQSFNDPQPVIIDLGMARCWMDGEASGICGTPGYIPPETYESCRWYPRGDVFSMGVVVYQLMTNRVPTDDGDVPAFFVENCETLEDVAERTISRIPPMDGLPFNNSKLRDLLHGCLHKQRHKRKTAPQTVQNAWLTSEGQVQSGGSCFSWCS